MHIFFIYAKYEQKKRRKLCHFNPSRERITQWLCSGGPVTQPFFTEYVYKMSFVYLNSTLSISQWGSSLLICCIMVAVFSSIYILYRIIFLWTDGQLKHKNGFTKRKITWTNWMKSTDYKLQGGKTIYFFRSYCQILGWFYLITFQQRVGVCNLLI